MWALLWQFICSLFNLLRELCRIIKDEYKKWTEPEHLEEEWWQIVEEFLEERKNRHSFAGLLGFEHSSLSEISCSAYFKFEGRNFFQVKCDFIDSNDAVRARIKISTSSTGRSIVIDFENVTVEVDGVVSSSEENEIPVSKRVKIRRILRDFFVAQGAFENHVTTYPIFVYASSLDHSVRLIFQFLRQFKTEIRRLIIWEHTVMASSTYSTLTREISAGGLKVKQLKLRLLYADEWLPLINAAYANGCRWFALRLVKRGLRFYIGWILETPLFNDIFGSGQEAFDRYATSLSCFSDRFVYNERVAVADLSLIRAPITPYVRLMAFSPECRRYGYCFGYMLIPYCGIDSD